MVDAFECHEHIMGPPGPRGPQGENGALIDPTQDLETYVKYINLRKKTLNSILGLVNISSNLIVYASYTTDIGIECYRLFILLDESTF